MYRTVARNMAQYFGYGNTIQKERQRVSWKFGIGSPT